MTTLNEIKDVIATKDKEAVLALLTEVKLETESNNDLMAELTTPEPLNELHDCLVEHLGVNPKLMKLRARVPNRRHRAVLYVQAMINGVNYLK